MDQRGVAMAQMSRQRCVRVMFAEKITHNVQTSHVFR